MGIVSSYLLEGGIMWMVIHLQADGTVYAVEDHDHYSGGYLVPLGDETHEQLFIRKASGRGFSNDEIEKFLSESKERQLSINK